MIFLAMASGVATTGCMGTLSTFDAWCKSIGISATTGWRWRGEGKIKTIEINGRNYVSQEAIDEFERRAKAGEFSVKTAIEQ